MGEELTPQQEIGDIDLVLLESVALLKEQTDPKEIKAWNESVDELLDERVVFMRLLGWKPE
jgi:hypothetical protein